MSDTPEQSPVDLILDRIPTGSPVGAWLSLNHDRFEALVEEVEADLDRQEAEADLIVAHDPSEGTTIRTKSRTWNDAIKKLFYPRFVWSGSRTAWYVQHSADKAVSPYNLTRIAEELRKSGATVAVRRVGGPARSFAEQVEDRKRRAEERADRYSGYAGSAAGRAAAAYQKADDISRRFEFGQPILVGHHSEGKARRDQERMHDAMRKSFQESDKAGHWQHRASAAEQFTERLERPDVVIRRIERLEEEQRRMARAGRNTEEQDEQIAYWKAWLEKNGKRPYGPGDFKQGDRLRGYAILKVGDKSVTIATRRMDWAAQSTVSETLPYTGMGSTTKPEQPRLEPEEKGKHPRAALIDAVYKHPLTPDAWKVRIGWKHGLAWEPDGKGRGTSLLILEDLPDPEMDRLAEERGIPTTGKVQKAEKHPHISLIRAIYSEVGSGYRHKEGGKHLIHVSLGNYQPLEDMPSEKLARIAFNHQIDPLQYGVSTGWTPAEMFMALSGQYSGSIPINGTTVNADDAKKVRYLMEGVSIDHAKLTPVAEIVEWVNATPPEEVLRVARRAQDWHNIPRESARTVIDRFRWAKK